MPLDYPVASTTFPNGLRVVVSEDRSVPVVAVNLWVGVGSADEPAGRTGFAHLFEHLMFEGSAGVAEGEHFRALQAAGGRANATTWLERTNFFEQVPTGALELALWLEADRHGRLLPAVTQANLDNQRDVVIEERRERYEETPYGTALMRLLEATLPPGHPFAHPTIGSEEDIRAASLEDVHAFYRLHYRPGATVLSLVGDLSPEEGFALAARTLGALPGEGVVPRSTYPAVPPPTCPRRVVVRDDVPLDRLYLAFVLPSEEEDGEAVLAAELALDVLGGLVSSRLYRALVRTDLAHSVSAHAMTFATGCSLGLVSVEVVEDQDAASVEETLLAVLATLAEQGPTEEELTASRADSERNWLGAMASAATRADLLSRETLLHGAPTRVNTYLDRLEAVTADQVRDVAARYLVPARRTTLAYLRDGSTAWPQEGR